MKRLLARIPARLAVLAVCVYVVFASVSCSTNGREGFAIYLTRADIPPAQMPALSHVDLAEKPIVSMDDIIAYDPGTHEIALTSKGYERISGLGVPVSGKTFLVCVDGQPIYWGAFWTPISSISFDGVTIWKPLGAQGSGSIRLELGYPSPSFYGGKDPRNKPEVMNSLEKAGKLKAVPSATTADRLPRSMKGYELYSWLENGQWHFTLITGTNRNKTLEEIVSDSSATVSAEGWVNIRAVGEDEIKSILGRLPENEYVTWLSGPRTEPPQRASPFLALPPAPVIDSITAYARQRGLEFAALTP